MYNAFKTTALLGLLTGLLVAGGQYFGGTSGALFMLLIAGGMNFFSWYASDKIVLRMSGAQPIYDPETDELSIRELRWVVEDVKELAAKADMPVPRIYLVPHERSPNAFATGRNPSKGVVAVTAGLVELLDRREVRGVLAHELGHIKHRDTLTSAVAATLAGAIAIMGRMVFYAALFGRDREGGGGSLALAFVAPLAATFLHMAISRTREFAADARAAELTGDPEGLARALERLSLGAQRRPMQTGQESTHYIVHGFSGGMSRWFSTHPPTDKRIEKLRAMA